MDRKPFDPEGLVYDVQACIRPLYVLVNDVADRVGPGEPGSELDYLSVRDAGSFAARVYVELDELHMGTSFTGQSWAEWEIMRTTALVGAIFTLLGLMNDDAPDWIKLPPRDGVSPLVQAHVLAGMLREKWCGEGTALRWALRAEAVAAGKPDPGLGLREDGQSGGDHA